MVYRTIPSGAPQHGHPSETVRSIVGWPLGSVASGRGGRGGSVWISHSYSSFRPFCLIAFLASSPEIT